MRMKMEEEKQWRKELLTVRQLKEDIREYQTVDVEKAFRRVDRRIDRQTLRVHLLHSLMRVAAFLTLPLLLATTAVSWLYWERVKEDGRVPMMETIAAAGERTRITLADGSVVHLNSGSRLAYPLRFVEKERSVRLDGEAFFEVEASRESPFTVTTPQGVQVTAHGTRFNVEGYADDEVVRTTLVRGAVDVQTAEGKRQTLRAGQQSVWQRGEEALKKQTADTVAVKAWIEGRLVFRDATLAEVVRRLSRLYQVDIRLHDADRADYTIRATFRDERIDTLLDYLCRAASLRWSDTPSVQRPDGSYTRRQIDLWVK